LPDLDHSKTSVLQSLESAASKRTYGAAIDQALSHRHLVSDEKLHIILKGFLYGVTIGNPVILAGVVGLICSVGLIAAWRPACRAASIDPVQALRSE
jgi:hypothetical protein